MKHTYGFVDGKIHNSTCEINVTEHCNLSCRGCSHLSPVMPKYFVDASDVSSDLTTLARHYHVGTVRLLGGEPLLHPNLPHVIAAVRASGISERVDVVTNGLVLPRMTSEFWKAVDGVHISMYPGHSLNPTLFAEIEDLAREHGVQLHAARVNKFRESYSEITNDDVDLVNRIFSSCRIVHKIRAHTVAHGMFFRCPQSYFIPKVVNAGVGSEPHPDGIEISDDVGFRDRLLDFLNSGTPPSSCSNCLGSAGRLFDHVQIRRSEFRQNQAHPAAGMFSSRQAHPLLAARDRKWFRK